MKFIGDNAFVGSCNIMLTAAAKEYAKNWAKAHGIPQYLITTYCVPNTTVQIHGLTDGRVGHQELIREKESENDSKPKLTSWMTGNLNDESYERIISFHIQGRSPPAEDVQVL